VEFQSLLKFNLSSLCYFQQKFCVAHFWFWGERRSSST